MIHSITVENFEGYFYCRSDFGTHHLTCERFSYQFKPGVAVLYGDIDCGGWGVSYGLSTKAKDTILSTNEIRVSANGCPCDLDKIYSEAWYMGNFNSRQSIDKMVKKGLKRTDSRISVKEVCDIFGITDARSHLPIQQVGNERFRCIAAVGYAFSKSVYCFPWISKKMVEYYGRNLIDVLEILEKLQMIAILPTNYKFRQYEKTTYDFQEKWQAYVQSELKRQQQNNIPLNNSSQELRNN